MCGDKHHRAWQCRDEEKSRLYINEQLELGNDPIWGGALIKDRYGAGGSDLHARRAMVRAEAAEAEADPPANLAAVSTTKSKAVAGSYSYKAKGSGAGH